MNDTVHRPVHLSVHFSTSRSVSMGRTYALRSAQFGRGQTPALGWNDPDFDALPRPTKSAGSFQPSEIRGRHLPAHLSGIYSDEVKKSGYRMKKVRITGCTVRPCHVFTPGLRTTRIVKGLLQQVQQNSPQKKVRSGGSDFTFSGSQPAEKFLGSLPPDAKALLPLRLPPKTPTLHLASNPPQPTGVAVPSDRVKELCRTDRMRRRIQVVRQDP
jgi:hypothetical protein